MKHGIHPLRPNPLRRQGKAALGVLTAALALAAGPGRAQATLTMNGQVVSTGVHLFGGSPYVKIGDLAKALGMVVVKRPGGYALQKPGGADQVAGALQGKVGDLLFDGQWRFRVLSVQTPETYTTQTPGIDLRGISSVRYDENARLLRAAPGNKLVVVQCRMANGQKTPQTFWLGHNDVKNALTDAQGDSYPPIGYDLEGAPTQSKSLLPGAGTSLPILFSVPEATQIQDLIFTLRNNDFSSGKAKVSDVRVSLTDGPGSGAAAP